MKLGVTLPHLGKDISPVAVIDAAQRAEALGYDSLWAIERLLYPTNPRSAYPVTADGSLPPLYANGYSPIETLTFAAAYTSRIALGTSVLVMPLHNPVVLARRLATLDVLSGGRLKVGLGQGWSLDEIEAAGASPKERAARADEFVEVLKAIWTSDPVEFQGQHFTLPRSILQPKPVQQPHPPIYMAGYVPSALVRVGRHAAGWIPSGVPLAYTAAMMAPVRAAAEAAGRDPASLELVIITTAVDIRDEPAGEGRPDFVGTLDEIRADVQTARDLGATEIIFMPGYVSGDLDLAAFHAALEQLITVVEPTDATLAVSGRR